MKALKGRVIGMNNTAIVWEKDKNYYVTNAKECFHCKEPFKEFVVIAWLDDKFRLFHINCNKEYKHYKHYKANLLASVVLERPKGAVFVGKPFDYLSNSNQLNNSIIQDGVKIIDKTIHAGRESLQGASIGLISSESKKLDQEIEEQDKLLIEKKEAKK